MLAQISALLLLFLILSSGSVFCCACFGKSYLSVLPITCTAITVVLFIFGLLNSLGAGVAAVVILSLLAYAFSAYQIYKNKSFGSFAKQLFTPGFFVFLLSFCLLIYLDYGRPMAEWDEFSHWGDIVAVMTATDRFGTAAGSGSLFQSYPPGMSLFQYFFQRVFAVFCPDAGFCEWLLFFAYQIFFLSFLLQFVDGFSFAQLPQLAIMTAAAALAPMAFFSECYAEIYIDPFIGIVSGAGLALVFTHKKHDIFYFITILLNISLLVLVKDAGMFFAVFLFIAFIGDIIIRACSGEENSREQRKDLVKKCLPPVLAGVAALALPKLLWSANVSMNNAEVQFDGSIDIPVLLDVIAGKDDTYRTAAWQGFWRNLTSKNFTLGTLDIPVPFLLMFLLLVAAVWGMITLRNRRGLGSRHHAPLAVLTAAAQFVVYTFGLCVIYIFKFAEHEAVELTSWSRYMYIVYISCWIFVVILLLDYFQQTGVKLRYYAIMLLCLIAVFIPLRRVGAMAVRSDLAYAVEFREERQPLVDRVFTVVGEDDSARINVISQGSTGFDFYFMHYALRPHEVSGEWSLGEPFYKGDNWTVGISAEQWQRTLAESYDYVVICQYNDYFVENYGSVFADADDIRNGGVYRVAENGMLELCRQEQ